MPRNLPASCLRIALAVLWLAAIGADQAAGQGVSLFDTSPPPGRVRLTDGDASEPLFGRALSPTQLDAPPTYEELLQRLEQTNSRLGEIESILDTAKEKEAADKKKREAEAEAKAKQPKKWYEKLAIRGYTQLRINEVFEESGTLGRPFHNGDSSIGDNQSFLIRRARIILFGDVTDHLYLYFQPDFASNVPGSTDATQYAQIRDLYADIYLDDDKEYRFRVGQSKVPYGWENLQSSQNRLPLDRNDAFNSAVRNERDLGVFFYWTPTEAQETFKYVMDEGLKGSGNYGVFGIGVYNGQGGSFREQNDDLHCVARLTLPMWITDEQILELSMQGYMGEYVVLSAPISPLGIGPAVRPAGTLENDGNDGVMERRLGWTLVYYPQPFGFQTEWTIGSGPALNPSQARVVERSLYGGYAMVFHRTKFKNGQELWPFFRWNYFQGGYRSERNAPYAKIQEWELGLEWQVGKALELVGMYSITDRTNTQAISAANTRSYDQFEGSMLRFQLQFNY